jgi:hypothetical protein
VSADLAARASLANRLPGNKGAHLQASQKNVSAHTHSSAAILQLQRAELRERTSRSFAVSTIIIMCIIFIIISCIRSEQTVFGASVASVVSVVSVVCRHSGALRSAALALQQAPADHSALRCALPLARAVAAADLSFIAQQA